MPAIVPRCCAFLDLSLLAAVQPLLSMFAWRSTGDATLLFCPSFSGGPETQNREECNGEGRSSEFSNVVATSHG